MWGKRLFFQVCFSNRLFQQGKIIGKSKQKREKCWQNENRQPTISIFLCLGGEWGRPKGPEPCQRNFRQVDQLLGPGDRRRLLRCLWHRPPAAPPLRQGIRRQPAENGERLLDAEPGGTGAAGQPHKRHRPGGILRH